MKKIKKILRIVFNRRALIILILLFQLGVFFLSIIGLSKNYAWVYVAFTLLSVVVVCVILNKRTNPAYKLAWIVPTLLMPVFGGIVYLIYSTQTSLKLFKKLTVKRLKDTERYLEQDNDILSEIERGIDTTNYSPYQRRVLGFISERLLDVWIETNKKTKIEVPVILLESQHWPKKIFNFIRRKFGGKKQ